MVKQVVMVNSLSILLSASLGKVCMRSILYILVGKMLILNMKSLCIGRQDLCLFVGSYLLFLVFQIIVAEFLVNSGNVLTYPVK